MSMAGLRSLFRHVLILQLLLAPSLLLADQYHSEVRELDNTPQKAPPVNPQQLLRTTTDPYARSMLLRDLAAAAAQKKDYAGAARYLEQALKQGGLSGPAVEQMRKDLSQLYLANGNYKDLVPQLEAQVKSGNAATETLIALGAAYVEKKRFREAVPLLQKGIASTKTPDLSWKRALVAALMGSGQDKDALPMADQIVRQDPTHGDDWLRLAALNLKYGSRERAQAVMALASRMGFLTTEPDRLRLVTLTAQLGAPFEGASTLQQWMDKGLVQKTGANWKTLAAMWVNARESSLAIPALEQAIVKAPSAELRPNQTDQDSLPPYDMLDAILKGYVEEGLSRADLVAQGFDSAIVNDVVRKVDLNEYKRKQAAPGLKITPLAFGVGRRIPIVQKYVS